MEFTFGIVTSQQSQSTLYSVLNSILQQNIQPEKFEVIIIGGNEIKHPRIRWYSFDETIKSGWITKKKNMITQYSTKENIVFMHDYITLDKEWYNKWCSFGNSWDIAMNRIELLTGERAIDWIGLPTDRIYGNVLLPYEYSNPKGMYIPGNYWIAKRNLMKKYPLNEELTWGQTEDIEWSKRVLGGNTERNIWLRNITHKHLNDVIDETDINTIYVCNSESVVRYCKPVYISEDFRKTYDLHSGDNSRPIGFKKEDYIYLTYR